MSSKPVQKLELQVGYGSTAISKMSLFYCVEELKSILIIFGALQQLVKSANQIVIWSMSFFMRAYAYYTQKQLRVYAYYT